MYNIVDISELKITVGYPNGTLSTTSHGGNLKLTNNVILCDVLVVPVYCVSLLSVNMLIRDSKMFVGFEENKCYIQDLKKEKVLGTGSESGGLYLFDMNNSNCIVSSSPNDDGKDSSVEDASLPHSHNSNSTQGRYQSDWSFAIQKPVLRRSDRQYKLLVRLNDYVLNSKVKYGIEKYVNYSKLDSVNMCFVKSLNKSIEPFCLSEAMFDPNWVDAMNNKIETLNNNNTWTIFYLPVGRKPIGSKWIWKIKYKALGEIEIYKARLVAKGFSRREGFDYDETFSHVVKMVTVRCLIGLAIVNNWPLYQLDVNNAFLYDDLVEDVYMTLSDGYNNKDKSKVCFEQSKFDYSLYTKHSEDKFIVLLVYVDDIVITRNDDRKYYLELLHEYGLLAARAVDIPLPENSILNFEETKNDNQHMHSPLQSHFKATLRVLRYLKEKVLAGIIKTVKVSSDLQTADVFTKCLGVVQHRLYCKNLGMLDVFVGELVGKDSGRKSYSKRKKSQAHQPGGGC
ncbi:ribonuclease H-like domain-containing protein [Tanacetum coccineum]